MKEFKVGDIVYKGKFPGTLLKKLSKKDDWLWHAFFFENPVKANQKRIVAVHMNDEMERPSHYRERHETSMKMAKDELKARGFEWGSEAGHDIKRLKIRRHIRVPTGFIQRAIPIVAENVPALPAEDLIPHAHAVKAVPVTQTHRGRKRKTNKKEESEPVEKSQRIEEIPKTGESWWDKTVGSVVGLFKTRS